MAEIYQVLLKFLDGKTRTLNFTTPTIPINAIKAQIQCITSIPIPHQLLLSNGKVLQDSITLAINDQFPSIHLLLRLRGGKGGFGSLLRGAATKAGQKKTNNFDACRDMSGRRLRHVNAEKKMEEWKADAEERRLEKVAEEFIKKQVKEGKKQGKGGESAVEKYVEKYRKDSAKCMEEVDKTVRESLGGYFKKSSKRKVATEEANGSKKKLKIWKGKRKLEESDSDDTDEDDSDHEMGEQNEKSVVTNNGNSSDSHKEGDCSSGSVTGGKLEGESSVGCSSESGSEEDKDTVENGKLESSEKFPNGGALNQGNGVKEPALKIHEESMVQSKDGSYLEEATASEIEAAQAEIEELKKPESGNIEEIVVGQSPSISTLGEGRGSDEDANGNSDFEPKNIEEKVADSSNVPDLDKPLNFDEYISAVEMEVLGMERLKSELQERGLKCGGTLQERAARLFLLKTIPLEKLPKKLLAKK